MVVTACGRDPRLKDDAGERRTVALSGRGCMRLGADRRPWSLSREPTRKHAEHVIASIADREPAYRFYQLGPYLENLKVEDITTAVIKEVDAGGMDLGQEGHQILEAST